MSQPGGGYSTLSFDIWWLTLCTLYLDKADNKPPQAPHTFKCLLSTYCVPGTALDAGAQRQAEPQ